ncbi:hypothetical protein CkaCkLH20_08495 [Colletotrichum karsti]|uniref:Uncharacterized protein n=1 Tax=Colletotrichum karsti TaxID=1095194 RepID=A0A9P6LI00_9PEZI|nr:uncharacterized protein CkaCkLH20_08495 [Colletotrichum karsti]KAF9874123.1 hypothetical protein CkaCkLH20_08495 [Colletotrichum karsti]
MERASPSSLPTSYSSRSLYVVVTQLSGPVVGPSPQVDEAELAGGLRYDASEAEAARPRRQGSILRDGEPVGMWDSRTAWDEKLHVAAYGVDRHAALFLTVAVWSWTTSTRLGSEH